MTRTLCYTDGMQQKSSEKTVFRRTPRQDLIWDKLSQSSRAMAIEEIHAGLESRLNKTTVYRVLEKLKKQGKVHSVTDPRGTAYFIPCRDCSEDEHRDFHYHFKCLECREIKCLPEKVSPPVPPGHRVESCELLLLGTCPKCLSS